MNHEPVSAPNYILNLHIQMLETGGKDGTDLLYYNVACSLWAWISSQIDARDESGGTEVPPPLWTAEEVHRLTHEHAFAARLSELQQAYESWREKCLANADPYAVHAAETRVCHAMVRI
jgi:hypothetical protein